MFKMVCFSQLAARLGRCQVFLLIAITVASGCSGAPQTVTGLPAASEMPIDERFIGFWQMNFSAANGSEPIGTFHIQLWPIEEHRMAILAQYSPLREQDPEWLRAEAYASSVNGQVYYSLQLIAGNSWYYCTLVDCAETVIRDDGSKQGEREQGTRFVLMRAELTDKDDKDQLFLHFMNPLIVKDLAEAGRVKARWSSGCGEWCHLHILDLSQEELLSLVQRADSEQLFFSRGIGPFNRVGEGVEWIDEEALNEMWTDDFR